jgi:hypothetical protein
VTFRKGEAALDSWTFAHAAGGALLAFFPVGWIMSLLLLIAYEFFEGGLRHLPVRHNGKGLFEYESWPNIFADVVVAWMAWWIVFAGLHREMPPLLWA